MITVFRPVMDHEEIEAVSRVLQSGWIGLGPETEKFERNIESYLGKKHIITTNSATAALHLSLIASGITKGDEVISPALTFVSTNHAILYQQATPIFCDIDAETLCADPQDIIRKITPKTRAIIVVHYGGHAVDMDSILQIAKAKHINVIEDAAHAFGGGYKGSMLGTLGDFGCFSFHAVKGVAMADGGAVYTPRLKTAQRLISLRWMGISKDTWTRSGSKAYSWQYDVKEVGFKYHTNDILAAVGIVQLKKLPAAIKKKKKMFQYYTREFGNVSWMQVPVVKPYTQHAYHNYCIKTKYRNSLSEFLAKKEIATTVHYEPNNHYSMYKKYRAHIPVTEKIWKELLLLPFHTGLTDNEIEYIAQSVKKFKP